MDCAVFLFNHMNSVARKHQTMKATAKMMLVAAPKLNRPIRLIPEIFQCTGPKVGGWFSVIHGIASLFKMRLELAAGHTFDVLTGDGDHLTTNSF